MADRGTLNTKDLAESLAQQAFGFKAQWWTAYVSDDRWPATLDRLEPLRERPGYLRVTRDDVFKVAADTSTFRNTRLLMAAYVWGTGESAFLVGRRARVFTRTDADATEVRLARARDVLYEEGAVAAYASLNHGGANHIRFLGPAFFTKFLYFAAGSPPALAPQPLVLDRRVAMSLRANHGWKIPDAGWSAKTYGRYLDFVAQSCAGDPALTPELVEFALFSGSGLPRS